MFLRLALRDLVLVALVIVAWIFVAPYTAGSDWAADLLGVTLGLAIVAACYLGHEWGHLLGALATRSVIGAPRSLKAISLFSFDSRRNDRRQFLVMSFSGFAMTGVALLVVYFALPEGQLATRVARGGVLFLTGLTLLLEFPLVLYSLLSSKLPPVETFEPEGGVATEPAP